MSHIDLNFVTEGGGGEGFMNFALAYWILPN